MAINLATMFQKQIASMFTRESFLVGKTNPEYTFEGVRSIEIATPTTQAEGTYDDTATSNRFGTWAEMQDTVQTFTLTKNPSFSIPIDNGNLTSQMSIKNSNKMLKLQYEEQTIPAFDKYSFGQFVKYAGKIAGGAILTKTIAYEAILDAGVWFTDNNVPQNDRYLAIRADMFKFVKQELSQVQQIGGDIVSKGVKGEIDGIKIMEIPSSYLPANCYFLAWHKKSLLNPWKIKKAMVKQDPAGLDGDLLEGRQQYDAFVIGAYSAGSYARVLTANKLTIANVWAAKNATFTLTSSDGVDFLYTLDGSDPRYSKTAKSGASGVAIAANAIGTATNVKAVVMGSAGNFASDVLTTSATQTA